MHRFPASLMQKINKINAKFALTAILSLLILVGFFFFQTEKPSSLNGRLRIGEQYIKEGKLALALEHYNKLVRAYPKSYKAHLKLGDLYQELNEPESAKIEYYRAINLGNKNNYDANIALANLYASQNDYDLAQDALLSLKDIKIKKVSEKIGDFYYQLGNKALSENQLDAVRIYKTAYEFYHKAKSKKQDEVADIIAKTYANISDNLLESNNIQESIKILQISIDFKDNAIAHYKLGRIYEKSDIDKAIDEYKKAFSINPQVSSTDPFVQLLIKKGNILSSNGKINNANYYYRWAKKLNPIAKLPVALDKEILLNLIATKYNEDQENNFWVPGITYRIINISKDNIPYLKSKVVFYSNNTLLGEQEQQISYPDMPLKSDDTTPPITIFSPASIPLDEKSNKIRVQIYLSQQTPDKWILYRNTIFSKN